MEASALTEPSTPTSTLLDSSMEDPQRAVIRARAWKEKAHKLAQLMVAQEAENKRLQRQLAALRGGGSGGAAAAPPADMAGQSSRPQSPAAAPSPKAHFGRGGGGAGLRPGSRPSSRPATPEPHAPSDFPEQPGSSADQSAEPGGRPSVSPPPQQQQQWGPAGTCGGPSLAELRALRRELEGARASVAAQAADLATARRDYESRKQCLKEAAGAARQEVLMLKASNKDLVAAVAALHEQNEALLAQLEAQQAEHAQQEDGQQQQGRQQGQGQEGQERPDSPISPASSLGGGGDRDSRPVSPASSDAGSRCSSALSGRTPQDVPQLRARLAQREGEVALLREDSRVKQEELLRALAEIQASRQACADLERQADNLRKQLDLTTEALESKDAELEMLRVELEEREGALQRLLAVCEAQAAEVAEAVQAQVAEAVAELQAELAQREALIEQLQGVAEEQGEQVAATAALTAGAGGPEPCQLAAELETQAGRIAELEAQAEEAEGLREGLREARQAQALLQERLESALQEACQERAARVGLAQRLGEAEGGLCEREAALDGALLVAAEAETGAARLCAELDAAQRQLAQQAQQGEHAQLAWRGAAAAALMLVAAQRAKQEAREGELQGRLEAAHAQRAAALRRLQALQHELAEAELLLAPLAASRPASAASSPARALGAAPGFFAEAEGGVLDASVAAAVTWLSECASGAATPRSGSATPREGGELVGRAPAPSRLAQRIRRLLGELQSAQRAQQAGAEATALQARLAQLQQERGEGAAAELAQQAQQEGAAAGTGSASSSQGVQGSTDLQVSVGSAVRAAEEDSASELHSPGGRSTAGTPTSCARLAPLPLPTLGPIKTQTGHAPEKTWQQRAPTPAGSSVTLAVSAGVGAVAAAGAALAAHPLPRTGSWCSLSREQEEEEGEGVGEEARERVKPAEQLSPQLQLQRSGSRGRGKSRRGGGGLMGGVLRTLLLAPLALAGGAVLRALHHQQRSS